MTAALKQKTSRQDVPTSPPGNRTWHGECMLLQQMKELKRERLACKFGRMGSPDQSSASKSDSQVTDANTASTKSRASEAGVAKIRAVGWPLTGLAPNWICARSTVC